MHRQHHADDRAQRVGGIYPADAGLAMTGAQQGQREQRQRHAGKECRRKHHQHRDARAAQHEQVVAAVVARQHLHQRRYPLKAVGEHRQRGQRRQAHQHLRPAGPGHRIGDARAAPTDVQPTECQAQNERRQHQLERMQRGAERLIEQAHPADLVDETGRAAEKGRQQHHPGQAKPRPVAALRLRHRARHLRRERGGRELTRRQPGQTGDQQIQPAGERHRARHAPGRQ